MLRFGAEPESNFVQQLSVNETIRRTEAVELDKELTERMNELLVQVEQSQQQTEMLVVNLRIQQAKAKADRVVRESDRRILCEEQCSEWLIATFREMATRDNR